MLGHHKPTGKSRGLKIVHEPNHIDQDTVPCDQSISYLKRHEAEEQQLSRRF